MNPIRRAGEYWAEDNARFEQTSPSFGARLGRAFNPLTGFGSAIGQVHSGMSEGNWGEAALGAAGALPVFAAMRMAAPASATAKAALAPSLGATAGVYAGNAAAGAVGDAAYAPAPGPEPMPPPAQPRAAAPLPQPRVVPKSGPDRIGNMRKAILRNYTKQPVLRGA